MVYAHSRVDNNPLCNHLLVELARMFLETHYSDCDLLALARRLDWHWIAAM